MPKVNIVVTVPDGVAIHDFIDDAVDAKVPWSFAPRSEVSITQDQLDELERLRSTISRYEERLHRMHDLEEAAGQVLEVMRPFRALQRLEELLLGE